MTKQPKSGDRCTINITRRDGTVTGQIAGYWTWNLEGTKLIKICIPE